MTALTSANRCDRCGAQAYLRATLPHAEPLHFCRHHGAEHEPALRDQGATIHDETARLAAPA